MDCTCRKHGTYVLLAGAAESGIARAVDPVWFEIGQS